MLPVLCEGVLFLHRFLQFIGDIGVLVEVRSLGSCTIIAMNPSTYETQIGGSPYPCLLRKDNKYSCLARWGEQYPAGCSRTWVRVDLQVSFHRFLRHNCTTIYRHGEDQQINGKA